MKTQCDDCTLLYQGHNTYGYPSWKEYIKRNIDESWTLSIHPIKDESNREHEEFSFDLHLLIQYIVKEDAKLEQYEKVPLSIELKEEEKDFFYTYHKDGKVGPRLNTLLTILDEKSLSDTLYIVKVAAKITHPIHSLLLDAECIHLHIEKTKRIGFWINKSIRLFISNSEMGRGYLTSPSIKGISTLSRTFDRLHGKFETHPKKVYLNEKYREKMKALLQEELYRSIILNIPHSRSLIPDHLRDQFLLTDEEIREEHLLLVDHYSEELFEHERVSKIVSPVSRLVIDLERYKDDAKESMANTGMGMVYTHTTGGKPLRRPISEMEKEQLYKDYYEPFMFQMDQRIGLSYIENHVVLLIDCHSFSSVPLSCDLDRSVPRPDICIGTDDYHTPKELIELVRDYFTICGYRVSLNTPFIGTFVPEKEMRRGKYLQSIMIEVNRSLYMNEETGEKLQTFNAIKQQLHSLYEKIVSFLTPYQE